MQAGGVVVQLDVVDDCTLCVLEREMPDIRHLPFEDAKRAIVNYIELYYNSARLHSGIGYRIPNDFFTVLGVHNT